MKTKRTICQFQHKGDEHDQLRVIGLQGRYATYTVDESRYEQDGDVDFHVFTVHGTEEAAQAVIRRNPSLDLGIWTPEKSYKFDRRTDELPL